MWRCEAREYYCGLGTDCRSLMPQGPANELLQVADAAAEARTRIQDERIQKPLKALETVCDEIKRAWSGSNIGYHATVYYEGLNPAPPGVQFSPEWGLMNRLASHRPHPGWQTMDFQTVLNEIFTRAGNPDKPSLAAELRPLRETFEGLQETAISILTVALSQRSDPFLERKLKEIQELVGPEPETIERTLVPSNAWSRDSLAMSQGLRIAPHQSVAAFHLAGSVLGRGIDRLEKLTRETASHLRRLAPHSKKAEPMRDEIFVGHGRSLVWLVLKDFIEKRLGLTVVEFNSEAVAGKSTTARLSELLDAAGFAFLVMTGEDEQPDGKVRARENVVHEAGLFQGKLGFERAIVLLEDGCEEFSNIHGLNQIRFSKGNIAAKFEEMRAVLEREGLIPHSKA